MGHVLEYISRCINMFPSKAHKELMVKRLLDELTRCTVNKGIVKIDQTGKEYVKIYDPSGDVVDKLCKYQLDIKTIFGSYIYVHTCV